MTNEESSFVKDILGNSSEESLPLFIFYGIAALLVSYHAVVYLILDADSISERNAIDQWDVSFNQTIIESSESAFIQSETVSFELEIDADILSQHHGFGILEVQISYTETSGILFDGCDSVSATLQPTGAQAQWQYESNNLSGTSDDCSVIFLELLVYPDYNSANISVAGSTPEVITQSWSDKSHGLGTFTLDVDVSSSSPAPPPAPQDNGEEITVIWSPVFFDVNVEASPSV
ncbi:MAG TPA: hypothetical protein HA330_00170 [Candidatus Thalassarchaeaceae archaeon]|nr:MAG TPA: hypothetical protein D7H85_00170 [Candidatus Poseidoniales archaeon]HII48277.1 hypothetical protein [Candidatus Thalassarchaeaceae archaeon]